MKILRQLNLEQELTAMGLSRTETAHFFAGSSPTAQEFGRIATGPVHDLTELSPTAALACPQDRLEALLRKRVVDHPLIDARFGTDLLDAQQHADHVEVRLRSTDGGSDTIARTSWLVGADGSRSRIRQLAGIGTDTLGGSCSNVNILLDADLGPLIRDRSSLMYTISNTEVHAAVLTVDNRRRWLVNFRHSGARYSSTGRRAEPQCASCTVRPPPMAITASADPDNDCVAGLAQGC